MDKIALVKREFKAKQWTEAINACRSSGMTVKDWCMENNINPKSYYYHLRRLREKVCEQAAVPVILPSESHRETITIRNAAGITVEIPVNAETITLEAVIRALKC